MLLNSAGIGLSKTVEDITLEEWRKVHAIDLDGVFLGCKHGVAEIKKHTKELGGSVINISSISGIIAGANMAAYNSAKAGVRLLSKSVALHCAKSGYNIRCNSVHPTFIDTPILDKYRDRFGQEQYAAEARPPGPDRPPRPARGSRAGRWSSSPPMNRAS